MDDNTKLNNVIATFCSYIPVEIIDAAGLTYSRVMGNGESISTKAKAMFPTYMCSFVANCLDEFDNKIENYVGAVVANSCHPMQALYECTAKLYPSKPIMILDVPRNTDEDAVVYFVSELKRFIDFLETNYNVNITEEKLNASIKKYNKRRMARAKLEDLIINNEIKLTAEEIVKLNNDFNNDNENYIDSLEESITIAKERKDDKRYMPRIMLAGNTYIPTDIVNVIEEYDGNVVLSNTCNSYRSSALLIDENKDPLEAIAYAYLNKPACARENDLNKRIEEFETLLDVYKIDAVIFSVLKFCTDQAYWMVSIGEILKERNIPFLFIDSDYTNLASGQIHTRIQAFLEML
ncbi:2-hydroxyacyl-CoA dehydratase subunit D [Cellulosilyticum ruminicola]|uniref:2-hydroxyacyl-CoA dehydratase subunit D n=1 Tax=Cellulosilyticum ruminicola TaxID=425254 RepID=UPI0006D00B62|nr:2-hydroxyacyl-CoA dehydratase family protein [Cellulosilyticum ruminicola]